MIYMCTTTSTFPLACDSLVSCCTSAPQKYSDLGVRQMSAQPLSSFADLANASDEAEPLNVKRCRRPHTLKGKILLGVGVTIGCIVLINIGYWSYWGWKHKHDEAHPPSPAPATNCGKTGGVYTHEATQLVLDDPFPGRADKVRFIRKPSLPATPARHRLEPPDGIALHGGGQDAGQFACYAEYLGAQMPEVFMTYIGVINLNTTEGAGYYFNPLKISLESYGPDAWVIPQIGLDMSNGPPNPYDKLVAEGQYDFAIQQLIAGIEYLERPAFIRIGYEFNGGWNGYVPADYIRAWTRIATAIRNSSLEASVALVWDYSCDQNNVPYSVYWPGNDTVDWWGVNVFSDDAGPGDQDCILPFIQAAAAQKYPVMFGESTPRGIGAQVASAWALWYQPYFSLIHTFNATVKNFNYIDWNWALYPQWAGWGDARIETPAAVEAGTGARMRDALSDPGIFVASRQAAVLDLLQLEVIQPG